jgi:iron complex outermembrane receptor protein
MRDYRAFSRMRLLRTAAPIAAVALAAFGSAAYAQSAPAGGSGANSNTVGEVVVTAQFREQSLQKTPLAITAVTGQMLEQRNETSLADVTAQAPNVTLAPNGAAFGDSMVAFIRGVGQTDFNLALEPGVGIYVDDVYYPNLMGSLLDLLDLDRVEILRGPQGTLAGKNSIGGAIKLYSQKPNGNDGGYVEGTFGSLDRLNARGAADFTIIPDKLFVRISADTENHGGYVTRYDYACVTPGSNLPSHEVGDHCVLGHDGSQAVTSGRIAVRWLPNERLEVNVEGDFTNDHSGVQANTLLKVGVEAPNPYNLAGAAPLGTLTYTTGVNGAPVFFGPDPYGPITVPPINYMKEGNGAIDIDYKLTDSLSLKSITGFQYYENQFAEQTDASPIGVEILLQRQIHHSLSQEFRLNGNIGTAVDYTVGGFYLDQDGGLNARVGLPWVGYDFEHGPDQTPANTKAVYGDATWHIVKNLDLSGGVRYSDENKDYTYFRHNGDGTAITNPAGYNGLLAGPPPLSGVTAHFHGTRTDYRVALQYQFTPDIMAYVDTATGYKGGGVDPRPFVETQAVSFQPETLTAYEAGIKTFWFDHKMRLNLAAFFNDYNNIQLTLSSCAAQSGGIAAIPCALPANVGDAHVKGFEAETEIHPVAGLELDGSFSYLNFRYTKITDPDSDVLLGMVTPYTPKWKWSVGAQYAFDLGERGSLTPRVDASYQSSVFAAAINDPAWNEIQGYTVFNARLTYRAPTGGWSTWLAVSNFTNKLYYLTLFDNHLAADYVSGQPAMPREWSITVKKTF